MKKTTLWVLVCLAAVFLAGGQYVQAKSLAIGSVDATGSTASVPITLSSDEDVQGYVLSVAVDTDKLMITDVPPAGATVDNNAELVVAEILTGGFTLGVVMDFEPPYDGQVIPANDPDSDLIATVEVESILNLACEEEETVPIEFQDGLNTPPLSNLLVVDGSSIYETDGLGLVNGGVTVEGPCDKMRFVKTVGDPGDDTVEVAVEVDTQKEVEGYVIVVEHPAAITLNGITTAGTAAEGVGVEFEVAKTYNSGPNYGGTIGVVFDFEPPYDSTQVLGTGNNQSLAIFTYEYDVGPCTELEPDLSATFDLTFDEDGDFGSPPLSNVLVEGGFSKTPELINTEDTVTFSCEVEIPAGIDYYVGGEYPEPADDSCAEPEEVILPCAAGAADGIAKVSFYYTSDLEPIQGISMALTFDPRLQVVLDMADLEHLADQDVGQGNVLDEHLDGTITEGLNVEFVAFNANNLTAELIIGILVDSTPPVPLSHMYPPKDCPEKVLNMFFKLPADAECGEEFAITFTDGVTGAGDVEISNRAAVKNESVSVRTHDGKICVEGGAQFIRGDCNTDLMVDIADPAATMSYLFLGVHDPQCLDACDTNDDGVVDLADVCATLRYLFKLGPDPLPPFPDLGFDPTDDIFGLDLGCKAGDPCNGE
jgi:hypothetical protein